MGDDSKPLILTRPQRSLVESNEQYNLFMAGMGSGKTHMIPILSAEFVTRFPFMRGLIAANTYIQLSKSTLNRTFDVWLEVFGWKKDVDYVVNRKPPKEWVIYGAELESYDKVISFNNGATIFIASLDNYKVLDGSEFGWAFLDETKDTKEEAVTDVVMGRLRQQGLWRDGDLIYTRKAHDRLIEEGKWKRVTAEDGEQSIVNTDTGERVSGWTPLYIFTTPAKVQWLNEFFDLNEHMPEITSKIFSKITYYQGNHKGKNVVISSTYHNQANIADDYITKKIEGWRHDVEKINRLIYASPISKSGGEWWSNFNRDTHTGIVKYDPSLPIHATFDFNVVPYMTMLLFQIHPINEHGRVKVKFFEEICLSNPRNTTEDCCVEFVMRYGDHESGLFIYGDPSGKARSTINKLHKHNFSVIFSVLRPMLNNASDRVLKAAPGLLQSRDFCSKLLYGGFHIDIEIDSKMKNTITDFEFLKEKSDGAYEKPKKKDPETKVSYEYLGHCSDAFRYGIIGVYYDLFKNMRNF